MLKLKRFSEGVWFNYPNDPDVRLKIRGVTPRNFMDIHEKSKIGKVPVRKDDGKLDYIDDYDNARLTWLFFDWMLQEWEGITVDGAVLKDEIKEAIFNDMRLRDFISDKASEVYSVESDKVESELKNSEGSPVG